MLFLFLELSDRPLEKTDLADLEKLKPPEPPSELTWEDIVRDDPLNEKCIWDDIDYAAHGSSDDDSVFVAEADGSDGDVSTTGDAADGQASSAQDAIIDPDETIIEKMANAQIPLRSLGSRPEDSVDKVESSNITELMVIRETLFMLAGLPILLCEMSQGFSTVRFRETLQLGQSSTNSVSSILKEMAELGTTLNTLRAWALRPQSVALLQVLRNCVEQDLRRFAKTLSDLQSTYISPNENSVVSILHVADRVRSESLLLVKEQAMVEELRDDAPPYQCLELLYDRICLTQLVGDTVLCRRLRDVFFRCFRYYLRPICTWMREGQIDDEYEDMFFVQENERPAGGPSLWHDQFSLRRNLMEEAFAPQFIHGPLKRILNTGKTAVFQRALGFDDSFSTVDDSRDSLIAMWEQPDDALLLPFAEEFAVTFNEWVTSQHTVASVTVKDRLFNDCGLSDCLDALEYLYLSRDGALFQLFADSLFNKLDARMPNWNDDFLLTDRLQTIFEPVPQIETDNINILLDITRVGPRSVKRLGTILIEYEVRHCLLYYLRGPLTNSTVSAAMAIKRYHTPIVSSNNIPEGVNPSPSSLQSAFFAPKTSILHLPGDFREEERRTSPLSPVSVRRRSPGLPHGNGYCHINRTNANLFGKR